jgi:23S rRNA pseudouridine1911/1915/1917 synthase
MFARTSKAAGRLSDAWRRNDVRKIYWAIGSGTVDEDSGEIEQWLLKDRARNIVRAVAPGVEGAKKACTNWRVLGRTNDKVFLEMEAITGRSHQLRVAATTLGIPLLGDLKYGAREPMSDRSVALHARRLEVPHPTRDERVEVEAPPPEIFERLWKP